MTRFRWPAVADAVALSPLLFPVEAYAAWGTAIAADPDAMYPPVRDRFLQGRGQDAAAYVAGWSTLDRLRADWAAAVAGYDAVILPTVPILPPPVADLEADAARFTAANLMALRNTRIGNLMGVCALTLPTDLPSCGLMLMGQAGGEARLLRVGAAVEAALL